MYANVTLEEAAKTCSDYGSVASLVNGTGDWTLGQYIYL